MSISWAIRLEIPLRVPSQQRASVMRERRRYGSAPLATHKARLAFPHLQSINRAHKSSPYENGDLRSGATKSLVSLREKWSFRRYRRRRSAVGTRPRSFIRATTPSRRFSVSKFASPVSHSLHQTAWDARWGLVIVDDKEKKIGTKGGRKEYYRVKTLNIPQTYSLACGATRARNVA